MHKNETVNVKTSEPLESNAECKYDYKTIQPLYLDSPNSWEDDGNYGQYLNKELTCNPIYNSNNNHYSEDVMQVFSSERGSKDTNLINQELFVKIFQQFVAGEFICIFSTRRGKTCCMSNLTDPQSHADKYTSYSACPELLNYEQTSCSGGHSYRRATLVTNFARVITFLYYYDAWHVDEHCLPQTKEEKKGSWLSPSFLKDLESYCDNSASAIMKIIEQELKIQELMANKH